MQTKNNYSKATVEDAIEFLWKYHGIAVGSNEYLWDTDKTIQEAIKLGWKISFGDF